MADKKRRKYPEGIQPTGSGTLRARIYHDHQNHHLGTFRTIGDAKAALAIARSEIARGTFVPPSQRRAQRKLELAKQKQQDQQQQSTVHDLAASWLEWLETMGRSTGTLYTYRKRLEQSFLPKLGDRPVVDLTRDDVTSWYKNLLGSNGEGAAKQHYRTVDSMFRYATGKAKGLPRSFEPWVKESPVDIPGAGIKKRTRRKDEVVLTADEIHTIADNMPDRERLAVLLAGYCALRIGEVLGLRREDISIDNDGTMWLSVNEQVQGRGTPARLDPTKTDAGDRDVPVTPDIADEVQKHLDDYVAGPADSFLFPRHPTGNRPHHPNTFRSHFDKARDEENNPRFKDLTFHGLRHSCLTRLGQSGATLSDLMAFAGHSDIESVLVYQHSERERLASLADTMAEQYRATTEEGA